MQNSQIATRDMQAANRPTPLPLRDDTILGVCEALGQDFGFNPLWLRVGLSAGLLWNPYAVVGAYFGLGLLVMISRLVFPPVRKAVPAARLQAAAEPEIAATEPQAAPERELIAA